MVMKDTALGLVQLHTCCSWRLVRHIQGHGRLKVQPRALCCSVGNLHNILSLSATILHLKIDNGRPRRAQTTFPSLHFALNGQGNAGDICSPPGEETWVQACKLVL